MELEVHNGQVLFDASQTTKVMSVSTRIIPCVLFIDTKSYSLIHLFQILFRNPTYIYIPIHLP